MEVGPPGTGRGAQPRATPTHPAPGGHRDRPARRRRAGSRSCSSGATPSSASWAAPGSSRAARSTPGDGEGDDGTALAGVREVRRRRRASRSATPAALVPFSRWITPRRWSRSASTRTSSSRPRPRTRRRRSTAPSASTGAGRAGGRARRLRGRASCRSSSRRSSTSSSSRRSTRADALLDVGARRRSCRSSRGSSSRARSRASCCPASPDTSKREAAHLSSGRARHGPDRRRHRADRRHRPLALVAALERHRDVGRVLGMARRPFDPAARGLDQDRVPPGRRARPRGGRRAGGRAPTSSSTSPSSIVGAHEETREVNLEGLAQRVRGDGRRPRAQAARLHVVGRRLRLPRRQPAAADRGRARPRGTRRATTTRAQKAEVEQALCEVTRGRRDRGLRLPPVHRRRPRRAVAIDDIPYVQLSGRLPGAVRRCST